MVELDTTISHQNDEAFGLQPIPSLEESAKSLSVPVSNPIHLSLLDQTERDFHTLYRQKPQHLSEGSSN